MRLHDRLQPCEIVILYVPPIFSQMQRNAVSAGTLCQKGCFNGIRIIGAARLPQGCDMINIDTQMLPGPSVQFLLLPVYQLPCAIP